MMKTLERRTRKQVNDLLQRDNDREAGEEDHREQAIAKYTNCT